MTCRRHNSLTVSVSLLLAAAWLPYYRVGCAGCTFVSISDAAAPGETGLTRQGGGCHKGPVVAVFGAALTRASIVCVPDDCCGSIGPSAVSAPPGGTTTAQAPASTAVPGDLPATKKGLAYPLSECRSHSPPRYLLLRSLQIWFASRGPGRRCGARYAWCGPASGPGSPDVVSLGDVE